MEIRYIKTIDMSHETHKYGIEVVRIDEYGEYLDTVDVYWFKTEHERNKEFKDLSF